MCVKGKRRNRYVDERWKTLSRCSAKFEPVLSRYFPRFYRIYRYACIASVLFPIPRSPTDHSNYLRKVHFVFFRVFEHLRVSPCIIAPCPLTANVDPRASREESTTATRDSEFSLGSKFLTRVSGTRNNLYSRADTGRRDPNARGFESLTSRVFWVCPPRPHSDRRRVSRNEAPGSGVAESKDVSGDPRGRENGKQRTRILLLPLSIPRSFHGSIESWTLPISKRERKRVCEGETGSG